MQDRWSDVLLLSLLLGAATVVIAARVQSHGRGSPRTWLMSTPRGGSSLSSRGFRLEDEKDLFVGRWRGLIQRIVRYPTGRSHAFDLVKQNMGSVMVFAWNTSSHTTTLIQEYSPGSLRVIEGIIAGGVEQGKHRDELEAAQFELEEEAQLIGGTWFRLLSEGTKGLPEGKYSTGAFHFFLVVDPQMTHRPTRVQDEEELLVVRRGVTTSELMALIKSGTMTVPSACGALLALEKLRELKLLGEDSDEDVGAQSTNKRPPAAT